MAIVGEINWIGINLERRRALLASDLERLRSKHACLRRDGLYYLRGTKNLDPEREEILQGIIRTIQDRDERFISVRRDAIVLIPRFYSYDKDKVIDILIFALKDPDPVVRSSTAGILGNIGSEAKAALRGLRRIASGRCSEYTWVQESARKAISKIQSK